MWWAPTSMTKIMIENGLFVLGRPETQLHDILWVVHDGKKCGRSEGVENIGEFPVRWVVGGRAMRISLTRVHTREMHIAQPPTTHHIGGVPGYGGWSGPSDAWRFARFSRTRARVGARRWALTEPERGVRLLNPSDCTAGYALLNPSDRSMAVN